MYISKAKKYRDQGDGTAIAYDYYRLTKSYIDKDGKTKHRSVLCLGELPGFDKDERNRLAAMLTTMIEDGQSVMCDNKKLYEEAMSQYVKYRSSKYAQENDPRLIAERKAREEEERKKAVAVKLETLTQHEARIIGCENLCNSTIRMLDIRKYLTSRGWKRDQINFALMQIIARAIYPYSELKTVRYLRENTALAEMFGISKEKITKDALYESAKRLWDEHRGLEDWLHDRVCSMFGIEEKILLFDITNSYFEGKMENSELCQYGRSKEKRDDCKIVVLAAVVNTEGLLVRTMIYEGNRHDSTTVEEVVGTLAKTTTQEAKRIVVMDAGFYSKSNVHWLKAMDSTTLPYSLLATVNLSLQAQKSSTIPITRDSRYACRWVRLTWMENPSRHSWWIVTQRVPRNAPCMSRHANVTRRDWKQSKRVFLPRAEPRNVTP